nr:hypothetical protein [Aquincola tertiaricarbonis]
MDSQTGVRHGVWLHEEPQRPHPQPPAYPVVDAATTRHLRQLKEK